MWGGGGGGERGRRSGRRPASWVGGSCRRQRSGGEGEAERGRRPRSGGERGGRERPKAATWWGEQWERAAEGRDLVGRGVGARRVGESGELFAIAGHFVVISTGKM